MITSPGGTICLITFERSMSWRVSNELVSARVSGVLDGRGYGVGQDGRQIAEGLGNVMGKLGPSYRWAGGRVNIWVKLPRAVADLVDFCSGGLRGRHNWLQNCLCI